MKTFSFGTAQAPIWNLYKYLQKWWEVLEFKVLDGIKGSEFQGWMQAAFYPFTGLRKEILLTFSPFASTYIHLNILKL